MPASMTTLSVVNKRKELAAEHQQPTAQHRAQPKGVGQRDEVAFLYAVQLARTVVLAHKSWRRPCKTPP